MNDSGIHKSSTDVSSKQHKDSTQADPIVCKSHEMNQFDVVIRGKPSPYEDDAMEEKRASSVTIKPDTNIAPRGNTCFNEKWDEGDDEAAVDEDIAVYQEVRPNDESEYSPVT